MTTEEYRLRFFERCPEILAIAFDFRDPPNAYPGSDERADCVVCAIRASTDLVAHEQQHGRELYSEPLTWDGIIRTIVARPTLLSNFPGICHCVGIMLEDDAHRVIFFAQPILVNSRP
ncbi:hypothetical protein HY632_01180 [Candidatus Uhrbacteria bacterium]|nr:hypothetical protein [Candidatus Uhrbacteria bacterium]